ncbi:NAD(+)/NADH kinase [bacterium]|nr:NAD(+)/NADH kinase [bacterium]
MKFALVLHPLRGRAEDLAERFTSEAIARGMAVSAEPADAYRVSGTEVRAEGSAGDADIVVAVGGDGTVLQAVRRSLEPGIPILGVNAGQVGFLTEVEPPFISDALDAIESGNYTIAERTTIEAQIGDTLSATGLNDVVIEKAVSQHVLRVSAHVGDDLLTRYRADAVVVATPTGSTAYTYSAGGPLLDPDLDAMVVTTVAPHTLFSRPIVFRPDVRLTLKVEGDRSARVNVDGRWLADLDPGDEVSIVRGTSMARFIRFQPRNFVRSVRDKFHLHDG